MFRNCFFADAYFSTFPLLIGRRGQPFEALRSPQALEEGWSSSRNQKTSTRSPPCRSDPARPRKADGGVSRARIVRAYEPAGEKRVPQRVSFPRPGVGADGRAVAALFAYFLCPPTEKVGRVQGEAPAEKHSNSVTLVAFPANMRSILCLTSSTDEQSALESEKK